MGAWHDEEFSQGYLDGRNLDVPEPSANRSHCYRHSFMIGRRERLGNHIPAATARILAAQAQELDGEA
jgi:hypothetical protein